MFILLFIILSVIASLTYLIVVHNNKVNNHTRFIRELFEKLQFYTINNSNRLINVEDIVTSIKNECINSVNEENLMMN